MKDWKVEEENLLRIKDFYGCLFNLCTCLYGAQMKPSIIFLHS